MSSAGATDVRTSGRSRFRTASICGSGSVASTSWPSATRCAVSLPVPAPSSRTVTGCSPTSQGGRLGGGTTGGHGRRRRRPSRTTGPGRVCSLISGHVRRWPRTGPTAAVGAWLAFRHDADPLAWLTSSRACRRRSPRPRRHRRDAARPRAAPDSPETTAESLLRGAHASAVLEGSASTTAGRARGRGRRDRPAALRISRRAARAGTGAHAAPLQAFARIHALAAAGSVPEDRLGRPRTPRRRPAAGAGPAADGDRGAGAAGRRRRARRPRHGGALRLPQRDRAPAPPSGWCWSRAASTRSRWSCRRPGTWPCARSTSRTCAATATAGGRRARLAALRRRGVRGGRGGAAASHAWRARVRTSERHPTPEDSDAAADT